MPPGNPRGSGLAKARLKKGFTHRKTLSPEGFFLIKPSCVSLAGMPVLATGNTSLSVV
jgi:hypothetical protein